jgi:hypothetical protein
MNQTKIEKYDVAKIEQLKMFLEQNAERGKPRYYEIFVDNLRVIEKTNDVAEFDSFQNFMNEDTRLIKILLYSSSEESPRNDKFIYRVKEEESKSKEQGLSGVEVTEKIQTALQMEKEKWDNNLIKKELEEAEERIEELEKYSEQLEAKIIELKQNQNKLGGIHLGEIAGVALEALLRNNTQLLSKYPLTKGLAGVIEQDNKQKANFESNSTGSSTTDSEVSFSEVNETNEAEKELSKMLREIMLAFSGEGEFSNVMTILTEMAGNKPLIQSTLQFIQNNQQQNQNKN